MYKRDKNLTLVRYEYICESEWIVSPTEFRIKGMEHAMTEYRFAPLKLLRRALKTQLRECTLF